MRVLVSKRWPPTPSPNWHRRKESSPANSPPPQRLRSRGEKGKNREDSLR